MTMTATDAKRLAVLAVLASGTLGTVASLGKGTTPALRAGVGVLAAGVFLTATAEVSPELAGSFSMLVLATAAFVYGGPAFATIERAVTPKFDSGAGGGGDFPTTDPHPSTPAPIPPFDRGGGGGNFPTTPPPFDRGGGGGNFPTTPAAPSSATIYHV